MTSIELKHLRTATGMSQKALADALGVWLNTVSRWEQGTRKIPEPTARLIKLLCTPGKKAHHPP